MPKIDREKRIATALKQVAQGLEAKDAAFALDALLFAAREVGAQDAEETKRTADATTDAHWAKVFQLRNDVLAVARIKTEG